MRWVSRYLEGDDISELVGECYTSTLIRICGTGDITRKQIPNILQLAERRPRTLFLGFSRKAELLLELNNQLPNLGFLLTTDHHTSDKTVRNYSGPMCYGPRLPEDTPDERRFSVIFPCRLPGGRVMSGMPKSAKDCPACWDKSIHCSTCLICFREAGLVEEALYEPNNSTTRNGKS